MAVRTGPLPALRGPDLHRLLLHIGGLLRLLQMGERQRRRRARAGGLMQVEVLDYQWTAEHFSEVQTARSPGLHLSAIIRDLDLAVHGNRYAETSPETRQVYFAMGFIWERILAEIIIDTAILRSSGTLVRPGEFVSDGIAMSPDAVDLSDYAIEEYKATWLSSVHPIDSPKFWPWLVQLKCYCRAIGTRRARLRAFFVNGDWRGSGPQLRAW